ncbi:MAG: serine hydrolase [Henriciella sp.]|nr:serine hydrolase [Henriciella sp.]
MFISPHHLSAIATTISLSLSACIATAAEPSSLPSTAIQHADQVLAPWVADDAPGVTVAVSWKDEIVYARGAGMANLEHNIPLTPTSVFQVASVSKQITAFATLLLVADGEIDLDADIHTYIPDFPDTEAVITVRHLLDHTSGLRERNSLAGMAGWLPDDIRTEGQMRQLVKRQSGVNFLAGKEIEYSNTGYALLAEIIERVSGQTFQTFTKDRIFDPLEMNQSQFPDNRNTLIPQRASSYYPDQSGYQNVIVAAETYGSTGLYTSALDLLKWAENFETRTVGSPMVFELMAERFQAQNGDDSTFAKGQELRTYKGFETWSHGGTDAGYRSFLLRVPSEDLDVVVISNRTDFDKAAFAFELADVFLLDNPPEPESDIPNWAPASPEDLAAYAGDYEIFPGVIFALRVENGGLTFASLGAPRVDLQPLEQIGPREFLLNQTPERTLTFDDPVDDRSATISYRLGMDGVLKAPRIHLTAFNRSGVELQGYAGRCESPELDTYYDIKLEDGALKAKHPRLSAFNLDPYQTDTFSGQGALQKLEFVRNANGQVSGFYASSPLAERVWFSCEE